MRTDLGHFPKSRDVIVFLPSTRDYAVWLACASLTLIAITYTFFGAPEQQRIDRERQEIAAWR
jgi:type II secretory pathway component PulM